MEYKEKAAALVAQMTTEEKTSLLSGADFWHTAAVERLGLPAIMMSDGPHGLRKQGEETDHLGLNQSNPATCFPTASALACSFDPALLREVGAALGEECRRENVSLLLGPGANIKRSPLCGRNFEYFSEDPLLSGELAAAMIEGIQSRGVGACLKHFAGNSQELMRLTCNSVIDERALHEIYLRQFEIAVKKARPWAVMSAYNLLNEVYCSEDNRLLQTKLRLEWGFDGAVITDWGAQNDAVLSYQRGLDLEMPGVEGRRELLLAAIGEGKLPMEAVDRAAAEVVTLILRSLDGKKQPFECDIEAHLRLAQRAARRSAVLLKNDGLLPGNEKQNIAVIGAFAETPRYQGGGSSHVNPIALDNALEAFRGAGCHISYAPGYSLTDANAHPELTEEAVDTAKGRDIVYLFAGLPDSMESEGFDRTTMELPPEQVRLIEAVCAANPNTAVILQCGSAVELPWNDRPRAILLTYLSGCQGGKAVVELLLGHKNPSGKLAETFPMQQEDCFCRDIYPATDRRALYKESIFVGYRYYDTAEKAVRYPFGHGLSYTTFAYSLMRAEHTRDGISVRCRIDNTGTREGGETVQLYIAAPGSSIFRPAQQLAAFQKVFLLPGGFAEVHFRLTEEDFACYCPREHRWKTESGHYEIRVGSSSRDIRLRAEIQLEGEPVESIRAALPAYYNLPESAGLIPEEQFVALYGRALPPSPQHRKPYTLNSCLNDYRHTLVGKIMLRVAGQVTAEASSDGEDLQRMMEAELMNTPMRQYTMAGIPLGTVYGLLDVLNGHLFRGARKLLKNRKK